MEDEIQARYKRKVRTLDEGELLRLSLCENGVFITKTDDEVVSDVLDIVGTSLGIYLFQADKRPLEEALEVLERGLRTGYRFAHNNMEDGHMTEILYDEENDKVVKVREERSHQERFNPEEYK